MQNSIYLDQVDTLLVLLCRVLPDAFLKCTRNNVKKPDWGMYFFKKRGAGNGYSSRGIIPSSPWKPGRESGILEMHKKAGSGLRQGYNL